MALFEGLELLRAPPRNPEVVRDNYGGFRQFFEELPLQSCILARTLVESYNVGLRQVHVVIVRIHYDSILEMMCPSECDGTEPLVLLNAYYLSGVVITGGRDNDVSISASEVVDDRFGSYTRQCEHFLDCEWRRRIERRAQSSMNGGAGELKVPGACRNRHDQLLLAVAIPFEVMTNCIHVFPLA